MRVCRPSVIAVTKFISDRALRIRIYRFAAALMVLALIPVAALASQQGILVMQKWKTSDKCTQQAQAALRRI